MIESIDDDDQLYRRIAPAFIKSDGSVSSKAFCLRGEPEPSISVDIGRLTTKRESVNRAGKPNFGLGILIAKVPRSYGFTIRHAPDPVNDNYSHALIEGENTKELCYKLAASVVLDGITSE